MSDNYVESVIFPLIESGDIISLNKILEETPVRFDINYVGSLMRRCLSIAINNNHETIAFLLINHGADYLRKDAKCNNALHLASMKGMSNLVKFILSMPGSESFIDRYNFYGETALFMSCANGHTEVTDILLKAGANPSESVYYYHEGPNGGINGRANTLIMASRRNNIEMVKLLLDQGEEINVYDVSCETPFSVAIANKNYEMMNMLINRGADINYPNAGWEPNFFKAVESNDIDLVRFLLSHGACVNKGFDRNPMILRATQLDLVEMTELLLSYKPKLYNKGVAQFEWRSPRITYALVEAGVDVNSVDHCGRLSIESGVFYQSKYSAKIDYVLKMAEYILEKGFNINYIQSPLRFPPMHLALYYDYDDLLELLLRYNPDLNEEAFFVECFGKYTYSPIYLASIKGNIKAVKLLLEKGALPCEEVMSNEGVNPLIKSIMIKYICYSKVYDLWRDDDYLLSWLPVEMLTITKDLLVSSS